MLTNYLLEHSQFQIEWEINPPIEPLAGVWRNDWGQDAGSCNRSLDHHGR